MGKIAQNFFLVIIFLNHIIIIRVLVPFKKIKIVYFMSYHFPKITATDMLIIFITIWKNEKFVLLTVIANLFI